MSECVCVCVRVCYQAPSALSRPFSFSLKEDIYIYITIAYCPHSGKHKAVASTRKRDEARNIRMCWSGRVLK